MLQRAASNAYSWWWASHVRTKQSKWLEQSLADMEEKVNETLKIVAHDGDSFAKRAEMYYRRRPEIISFVEESFKAYRSLAEKYDHLSRELQSANRTIAQVFPEKAQFALDEEAQNPAQESPKTPKSARKTPKKRSTTSSGFESSESPTMSKDKAVEEIDKLQKIILSLQTEKEFVRSVYENAANKYGEMDEQINEMQAKISSLQDEFGIDHAIEDSEARSLMATTALKSCKQTLQKLQEKHDCASENAKSEDTRIKEAYQQLETLKGEFLAKYLDNQKECTQTPPDHQHLNQIPIQKPETDCKNQLTIPEQSKQEMNKENDVASSDKDLSVMELSEKIDELVTKVVKQETSVTSQDTLVKRLTSETDEIKGHIQELKGEKENLTQSSESMRKKIEELEDELCKVRNLKQTVEDHNTNLHTQFMEATYDIEDLSKQMHTAKLDEELDDEVKDPPAPDTLPTKETKKPEEMKTRKDDGSREEGSEEEAVPPWRLLYLDTLDDRERNLLEEYSSVLQNYKDVRRRLNDAEERNRESIHDLTIQMRELVKSNAMRDAEIVALRQQLNTHQSNQDDHSIISSPGYFYSPMVSTSKVDGSPVSVSSSVALPNESTGECGERIQKEMDQLLEDNLEFWLRFSNSIQQKRKFQATIQDLKAELSRAKVKSKSPSSDSKATYRHLREIHTEVKLWVEQSAVLREEVQSRFSHLSHLQDEISEEVELTQNQAAKFQGEVLNMKQENMKIGTELEVSLERVKALQHEVEGLLEKLDVELGVSSPKCAVQSSRPRIPLRSFLFGVKLKKKRQKSSLFSCVGSPNPRLM